MDRWRKSAHEGNLRHATGNEARGQLIDMEACSLHEFDAAASPRFAAPTTVGASVPKLFGDAVDEKRMIASERCRNDRTTRSTDRSTLFGRRAPKALAAALRSRSMLRCLRLKQASHSRPRGPRARPVLPTQSCPSRPR